MADEKRLVDATPIIKFIEDGLNNPDKSKAFGHDAIEILTEIEFAPTVDAVEVVRCKECKHWHYSEEGSYCENPDGLDNYAEDDDFCSCGERKDKSEDES